MPPIIRFGAEQFFSVVGFELTTLGLESLVLLFRPRDLLQLNERAIYIFLNHVIDKAESFVLHNQ